jgi:ABC-type lipoprotein export system ATPase subunit
MSVMGLRTDYNGTIRMNGRDITEFSINEWVEYRQNKLAVVFQDLQLFPNLSVAENLLLKNSLHHVYSEKELLNLMERLEIDNKWTQSCGLLSMGQQQRVAILRALCQPFELLLLDEPFSHLDEENTRRCITMINERCGELKAGFVLTSLGDTHQFNYDKELKL